MDCLESLEKWQGDESVSFGSRCFSHVSAAIHVAHGIRGGDWAMSSGREGGRVRYYLKGLQLPKCEELLVGKTSEFCKLMIDFCLLGMWLRFF